jgi:hypothetical protein
VISFVRTGKSFGESSDTTCHTMSSSTPRYS